MRMPSLVLFPALLLSAASPTSELRKCIAPSGAVSYQTLPCAEHSHQAWVQPVKAESIPRQREAPSREEPVARREPRPAARASPPRRTTDREARRERCNKARRDADDLRDRLWNKLSFQERSDLDDKVTRACAR